MDVYKNKKERHSRVPRPVTQLKGPKENGDMQAILKCATYPCSQCMWAVDRLKRYGSIDRYWRDQYISVNIFYLARKLWAPQAWAACER